VASCSACSAPAIWRRRSSPLRSPRVSSRQALALGAGLRAVALIGLFVAVGEVGAHGSIAWLVLPLLVDGAGMGLVTGPLMSTVLANVSPQHAGAASGVLSTAQQVGNAVGVAVIGIAFFGAIDAGHTIAHAFRSGLLDLAVLNVVLAGLVHLLPRGRAAQAR
jgi:hypothetical protein